MLKHFVTFVLIIVKKKTNPLTHVSDTFCVLSGVIESFLTYNTEHPHWAIS